MPASDISNPFDFRDEDAYRKWRKFKLETISDDIDDLRVGIEDLSSPDGGEIEALRAICRRTNWAIFHTPEPRSVTEDALKLFAARLGLKHIDRNPGAEASGVTALTTAKQQADNTYIPYTNLPLGWHTDGYYNDRHHQIRAWILFCAQDAAEGGANSILDHELLYIQLRDRDPDLVKTLMDENAMTIPANEIDGEVIRPQHSGPVFSIASDGNLHMRYSARKRNILWQDSNKTRAAARAVQALLSDRASPICHYRLKPGEGVVSNNVLHRRDGFRDDPETGSTRLVLRTRFHDRIQGTDIDGI